ncbi:MAG: helix-turn-helix domain-containing protein [Puniceicoccales bacterium]|jgi:excisionase family DNA binding protein|nr:helix-turn-helix domain-containing protein [Puniceicoccales bacterium]
MSVNGNAPSSGGTYTYLTREEATEYLRLSPAMLRDNHKPIPSYKLGGKTLYTREDLDGQVRPQTKGGSFDEKFSQPKSGWDQKGIRTYLTREEAAEYLRVTPAMLRDNYNHIPSYKLGGKVLYTKEDLDGLARP